MTEPLDARYCPDCGSALDGVDESLRSVVCPEHGRLMINVTQLPTPEGSR